LCWFKRTLPQDGNLRHCRQLLHGLRFDANDIVALDLFIPPDLIRKRSDLYRSSAILRGNPGEYLLDQIPIPRDQSALLTPDPSVAENINRRPSQPLHLRQQTQCPTEPRAQLEFLLPAEGP